MTTNKKEEYLIYKLADNMKGCVKIDADLFRKLDVKRGLRNEDGTGVLVGLTNIGNVVGYERTADGLRPIEGKLYFRGYEVSDLVHAVLHEQRFGYEEIAYLLLSGRLPDSEELEQFRHLLVDNMPLMSKTTLNIVELEGNDIMNILARSVLELYTYDANPDDISRENLMRQSVELISKFPTIIAYAYNMLRHKALGRSLHIRHPKEGFSLAENFLYMLLGNHYTPLDARTLDLLLILQAEHGGGNNSTFTVRVTSSTCTDTYSSIAGHAVYTLSDPRAVLLKEMARKLAEEKGRMEEFEFMERIEKLAVEAVYDIKGTAKKLCANVDFYSGFVYDLIGLPIEIYTPLFAMARIVGWCAHRNEELGFVGRRIIRPAYRCVADIRDYVPVGER